jgi:hypothetical protein
MLRLIQPTYLSDVLDLFAAGLSAEEILEEMPDLEANDLKASLGFYHRFGHKGASSRGEGLAKTWGYTGL